MDDPHGDGGASGPGPAGVMPVGGGRLDGADPVGGGRRPVLVADTLRGPNALGELAEDWRTLEASAARVPAPLDLLTHVARTVDPARLRVVTLRARGSLVGLWPLVVTRRGPVRVVSRMGGDLQPYDGVLCGGGLDPVWVAAAAWSEVEAWSGVDVVHCDAIRADAPLARVADLARWSRPRDVARELDLQPWASGDAYQGALSRNRRRSLRRTWNQLQSRGALRFDRVEELEARRAAVTAAVDFKRAWLAGQGALSRALAPASPFADTLQACASDPRLLGRVEVFCLRVGDQIAAVEIGFVDGRRYRSFLGAFAPDFARAGVGVHLTVQVIRWCLDQGLGVYDMLPPDTAFKGEWTSRGVEIRAAAVPLTSAGRLGLPFLRDGKRWAKRLYATLPDPLQGPVRWAVGRRLGARGGPG